LSSILWVPLTGSRKSAERRRLLGRTQSRRVQPFVDLGSDLSLAGLLQTLLLLRAWPQLVRLFPSKPGFLDETFNQRLVPIGGATSHRSTTPLHESLRTMKTCDGVKGSKWNDGTLTASAASRPCRIRS
jgi:hypothetical protein